MKTTTMAAVAVAAAAAVGVSAAFAAAYDQTAELDGPPGLAEEGQPPVPSAEGEDACDAEARIHEQADKVMARYGFVYEEPEMTPELEASLEAAFASLESEFQKAFSDEAVPYGTPSPEQAAEMAALHEQLSKRADALLREHGFVIEEPDLSEDELAAMNAELDAVYQDLDAVYEQCYGGHPGLYMDASSAEADEVMAGYGFVYEEPEMTPELEALIEADMAALYAELEERTAEAGYLYYGDPTPEQAAEAAALYAEFEERADDVLRSHGFVIERPDLSEQDAAQLAADLEAAYGQTDSSHG